MTDQFYSLVNPEEDFDPFIVRLTGISRKKVRSAPTFPALWERIAPIMGSGVLTAHNAPFDLGVLRRCLRAYGITWKSTVPYLCTVQMGKRLLPGERLKLDALCAYYGIPLNHHHAGSDSRACGEILLRYLAAGADPAQFLRTYDLLREDKPKERAGRTKREAAERTGRQDETREN